MKAAESKAKTFTSSKLLIVDDEVFNRQLLTRHLNRDGFTELEFAENGLQALNKLESGDYDLVLLDIEMPQMDGFQTLSEIHADSRLRNVPVIMISGLEELDSVVKCIELGAEDYLIKPFNPVLLRARINASLEKKQLRDSEVALRKQSDDLLHAILPARIAEELKTTGSVRPRRIENVAILMGDIVGFTPYCESHDPHEVIADLQVISIEFERITEKHKLAKMSAVGDAFMAVASGDESPKKSVLQCVKCGLELQRAIENSSAGLEIRVGVHIGPVIAGIVGKKKFLYGMFGDAVNTASRMESSGRPGIVCLSSAAWDLVSDTCAGTSQGLVEVKGKGKMELYYVTGANK